MSGSAGDLSREDLLARTPDVYLAEGWTGADGAVRRALLGLDATAGAVQMMAAGAAPQELAFTYEAVKALLPLQEGEAGPRMRAAAEEALETVARMIRQPNNEGIAAWLRACAALVRTDGDGAAMLLHMQAVLRQHGLMAAMPEPGPEGGEGSPGLPPDALPSSGG